MWTIDDLPAHGNLARCKGKGNEDCPVCSKNSKSQWLKLSRKSSYMGHRRFLPPSHPFRKKKSLFDGREEKGSKPKIMSGNNILVTLKDYVNNFGKAQKLKGKTDEESMLTWKRRSIFFNLPYWEVKFCDSYSNSFNYLNFFVLN